VALRLEDTRRHAHWHARLGQVSNAPQTYMLDGKQYVIAAAGDRLYAFYL
jgi:alcohol dehydrogenase (cytochrome c)